ncbi:MAG TPA: DUF1800 family protein, partial [Leucothrix mucor]|nr:DUF1800 family protein [Leucothrix mucor]
HPAMGDFLSMTRNQKANVAEGIRPDENYARELLQLFSIGVHELNLDATKKLDANGNTIPTYNQSTIEQFAKVFTGWTYRDDPDWDLYFADADHTRSLVAHENYHDRTAKNLLNGAISPANRSALVDLRFALDNIFNHPNVGPFVSKRLIQRLVTSNPAPDYVARVATVFNDNGEGERGDLKAVVKAILLDDNARRSDIPDHFGKLREPLLRITHLWRAFKMQKSLKVGHYWDSDRTCGQGTYPSYNFWKSTSEFKRYIGQGPLQASSVFNFYLPDFSPAGTLNDQGIAAPEFQIINENTLAATSNFIHETIEEFSDTKANTAELEGYSKLNLGRETALASNTNNLLNHLNLVLLNGEMSPALRTILTNHLNKPGAYPTGKEGRFTKAKEAILLMTSAPDYLIQR